MIEILFHVFYEKIVHCLYNGHTTVIIIIETIFCGWSGYLDLLL